MLSTIGVKTFANHKKEERPWGALPPELLFEIFSYLDNWTSFEAASKVCMSWHQACHTVTAFQGYVRLVQHLRLLNLPIRISKYLVQVGGLNHYRILHDQIIFIENREVCFRSFGREVVKRCKLPFSPLRLRLKRNDLVAAYGESHACLIHAQKKQMIASIKMQEALLINRNFVLKRVKGRGALIASHDGKIRHHIDLEGVVQKTTAHRDFLALSVHNQEISTILLFNWKSGQQLYKRKSLFIVKELVIHEHGTLLYTLENMFCGGYASIKDRGFFYIGNMTINGSGFGIQSPYFSYILENRLTICSCVSGSIETSLELPPQTTCLRIWRDRLVLFSTMVRREHGIAVPLPNQGVLRIFELPSCEELFYYNYMRSEIDHGDRPPEIHSGILVLRTFEEILLLDLSIAEVLNQVTVTHQSPSLATFDGKSLIELIPQGDDVLRVISRQMC